MRVVHFSVAKNQFNQLIDEVLTDCDVAIISSADGEGIAVMQENIYSSIMETLHLLKSPANVRYLEKSLAQYLKC